MIVLLHQTPFLPVTPRNAYGVDETFELKT